MGMLRSSFWVCNLRSSDFFWVRDFGKDSLGLTKSETQGSLFYVKQLYQFHLLKVSLRGRRTKGREGGS